MFVALLVLMPEPGSAFVAEPQTCLTFDLLKWEQCSGLSIKHLLRPVHAVLGHGRADQRVCSPGIGISKRRDDQEFKEAMELPMTYFRLQIIERL